MSTANKLSTLKWNSTQHTLPKPHQYVLVRGPSGCSSYPHQYSEARYDYEDTCWKNVANDGLSDSGLEPTEWASLT